MFQQATWFGLSLALHLAVVASLLVVASRNVDLTPKAIMVVLDNLAPTEPPQHRAAKAPRPAAPPRASEPAKPLLTRQVLQPAEPQAPPTTPAADQSRIRDLPKASAETAPVSNSRTRAESISPATQSQAVAPVRQAAASAEERPTPEKAQQRYLKEHFSYIRDLITKQLSYPPMARKMRWSGKVLVAFVIAEDGSAHNIRVMESSGFPILDKSATETVRSVAPFPRPPVRAEIVLPVSFKML